VAFAVSSGWSFDNLDDHINEMKWSDLILVVNRQVAKIRESSTSIVD